MNQKQKGRYMKRIVAYCLALLTVLFVASYALLAAFGVDTEAYLTLGCGVFGGELLMTLVLRLVGDKDDPKKPNDPNDTGNG